MDLLFTEESIRNQWTVCYDEHTPNVPTEGRYVGCMNSQTRRELKGMIEISSTIHALPRVTKVNGGIKTRDGCYIRTFILLKSCEIRRMTLL